MSVRGQSSPDMTRRAWIASRVGVDLRRSLTDRKVPLALPHRFPVVLLCRLAYFLAIAFFYLHEPARPQGTSRQSFRPGPSKMYGVWHRDNPEKPLRKRRTKDGCVTCKRRRVRCNLERPCCGHCSRLNLECSWSALPPSTSSTTAPVTMGSPATGSGRPESHAKASTPSSTEPVQKPLDQSGPPSALNQAGEPQQQQHHLEPSREAAALPTPTPELAPLPGPSRAQSLTLERTFNFASFLWDPTAPNGTLPDLPMDQWTPTTDSLRLSGETTSFGAEPVYFQDSPPDAAKYSAAQLLDHFKLSEAPPILAPLETRSSWYLMRDQILSMAHASAMVHYAILAYSALQMRADRTHGSASTFSSFYIRSQEHVTTLKLEIEVDPSAVRSRACPVLAALFLLSYVDLVTNRTSSAQANLGMAYRVATSLDKDSITFSEKRLISWLRLLDGRAVSAGGEGLFLKEDSDGLDYSRSQSPTENDTEAAISELLSKPSLRLFQKTQSYMGRITKIDQWHRRRGTVEDETEVMSIASEIRRDYRRLHQQLHPILEQATSGNLTASLLSPSLATSVTKKCRIAMANYHAIPIHLHRVAYRHLPRSTDVNGAVRAIQGLAHDMRNALTDEEALPVNMLWPLLMWGSEEVDAEQRVWIVQVIRQMANSVSNAGITADVLEGLWRRQDGSGERHDIRTVMHETFNACFAII